MKKNLFFISFIFFLISCSSKQPQADLSFDGNYFVINLDEKKDASIPLSFLFKRAQTIILETSDNCLVGHIDDLQVFEENMYILDSRKAKSLFVFNSEGKFIRKIGSYGNGPGEYNSLKDFSFDSENKIIFILDHSNRIHKYKSDGAFIETIVIELPRSNIDFIQIYDGNLYAYCNRWESSNEDYMLLEVEPRNGKIISKSLPIKYNKGWNKSFTFANSRFFMSRGNNPPRFCLMFMDYIVSVGEVVTPFVELKSKYLTTENDIESFRGEGFNPINPLTISNSNKLFNVHCFIENDDFLCFRLGISYSPLVVICDKMTGSVKLVNKLSNDLIFNNDQSGMYGRFIFADKKGAYDILHSVSIESFKESIRNKETVPDLDKADQLLKLEDDANPVIFYYEFK